MTEKLRSDIDAFLAETGMGDFRFGLLAAKNGRLVDRLRNGGRVWPETEAQIRDFMREYGRAPAMTSRLPKTRGSNAGVAA